MNRGSALSGPTRAEALTAALPTPTPTLSARLKPQSPGQADSTAFLAEQLRMTVLRPGVMNPLFMKFSFALSCFLRLLTLELELEGSKLTETQRNDKESSHLDALNQPTSGAKGRFLVSRPSQSMTKLNHLKGDFLWWSSGQDSMLSLLKAQVQALGGELRSHKLCGRVKKLKNKIDTSPTKILFKKSPGIDQTW